MKPQIEITPLEWDVIETYLDQNDALEEAPLLNTKLNEISNVEQKLKYVKRIRTEIEDSIRQSKIKEFHSHIAIEEEDLEIKHTIPKRKKFNAILYSAAAVLIVLFGIFWMMDNNNNISEKIFAKNFKPDVGLPLKMGTASSYEFYEGMVDYKQEKYKDAIAKWQVLLKADPENDTLNYFLGVANLALGKEDTSLEYLQPQERFQDGMFREDGAFYAALAEVKKGNFDKAEMYLKKNPSVRNTNLLRELENR